jgi:hypothetical protein
MTAASILMNKLPRCTAQENACFSQKAASACESGIHLFSEQDSDYLVILVTMNFHYKYI